MNSFNLNSRPGSGGLRTAEGWMEIGLAVAAAAFSLAIWLDGDARPGIQLEGATLVTFPTVVVSVPR